MEWLQSNWYWLLFGGVFVWMHLSGRGCCSHGSHGKDDESANDPAGAADSNMAAGADENSNSKTDTDKHKSKSCCH